MQVISDNVLGHVHVIDVHISIVQKYKQNTLKEQRLSVASWIKIIIMPYLVIHLCYVYILASLCLPYIISRESKVTNKVNPGTNRSRYSPIRPWTHDLYTYPHLFVLPGNSSIKYNKRNRTETMSNGLYHQGHVSDYHYLVWFKHILLITRYDKGSGRAKSYV